MAENTRTIQVGNQLREVRNINFQWVSRDHPSVVSTWEQWLHGTTPQQLKEGFYCTSDAIAHFLTDLIENNPFNLTKEVIEGLDIDWIGSLLLAYVNKDLLQDFDGEIE
jgi:hypothetical protein